MRFSFRRRDKVTRQLIRDRERLALLEVGGSRDRPFHLASASVVEVRCRNLLCPQCQGDYKLIDHRAPGNGLRQATVICTQCGISRDLWFMVITRGLN